MRTRLVILVFVTLVGITALAHAQDTAPPQTLFTNIKIFNGTDDRLIDANVLVEGSLIKEVGKNLRARKDATVIDGGGKTLMPGLIDNHVHYSTFLPLGEMRSNLEYDHE